MKNNLVIDFKINENDFSFNIDFDNFFKINSFEDLLWWKKNKLYNTFAKKILEYQYLYESMHLTLLDNISGKELDTNEVLISSINNTFLNELYCSSYILNDKNIVIGISKNYIEDVINNEIFQLKKIYIYIHEENCFYRIFSKNNDNIYIKIKVTENCNQKLNLYKDPDPINIKYLKNHIKNAINALYENEYIKSYNKKNIERFNKSTIIDKITKKIKDIIYDNYHFSSKNGVKNEKFLTFYERIMLRNCDEYFSLLKKQDNINLQKEIYRFIKIIESTSMPILYQFLVKKIFENFSQKYYEKMLLQISSDILFLIISNGLFKEEDMLKYLSMYDNERKFLIHFLECFSSYNLIKIDPSLNSKFFQYLLDKFSKCYGTTIVNKILLAHSLS